MNNIVRTIGSAVALTIGVAAPAMAQQQADGQAPTVQQGASQDRLALSVFGSAGYTDNLGRTAVDGADATIFEYGFNVDWSQSTRRFSSSAAGSIGQREFSDSDFGGQTYGDLNANAAFTLISERLQWQASNQFGQARNNQFLTANPNNLQNVNRFSTGPVLTLPIGNRFELSSAASFTTASFEDADQIDNDSVDLRLGVRRALSQQSAFGFDVIDRSIDFKDTGDSEFDVTSYVANWSRQSLRGSVSGELGFDRLSFLGSKDDSLRFRLAVSRRVAAYSNVTFSVGQQVTDAGQVLGGQGVGAGVGGANFGQINNAAFARQDDVITANEPLTRTSASMGFNTERQRISFGFGFGWAEDSFENVTLFDNDRFQFSANATRRLSERSSVVASAQFIRREFQGDLLRDDEWQTQLTYRHTLGSRVQASLTYTYRQRNAGGQGLGDTLSTADFDENVLLLSFSYSIADR